MGTPLNRNWKELRTLFGSAALVSVIISTACSAGGETPAVAAGGGGRGNTGTPVVPVSTATVEQKSVPLAINVIGSSEAFHTVAVRAQITGGLTSVKFREGDDVKEGQVLFELDRRPLEAALAQAQANLARDTAQEANARASAARYQDLLDKGIATKEQADQSRTAAAALTATLQSDRAAIDNATVQLQYATIAAPISGRTGALMVHEGEAATEVKHAYNRALDLCQQVGETPQLFPAL